MRDQIIVVYTKGKGEEQKKNWSKKKCNKKKELKNFGADERAEV